ncbi:Pectinesterase inhibitor domain [Dillenia turbinata]|uniref:Pectinesterase inhibitor domain n=1 Tax=Dillenia turbinata TaxID=194707 RepID=A0AAN8V9S5_9MAGN
MAEKKKIAILGVSSLLLVAMVVGVAIGLRGGNGWNDGSGSDGGSGNQISTSSKAVESVCQPTDYKDACVQSLSKAAGNTSDPKEIIKAAFTVAVDEIKRAMSDSQTLKELEKDPQYASAIEVCKEVMEHSIDDLERSYEEFSSFELSKIDDYLEDLNVWLSGSIAFQETCLDAFQNTTGDAGEKMKELLKSSGQLTSNALAIVTGLSSALSNLKIPGLSRRLFSEKESDSFADGLPSWVIPANRHLLQANAGKINPNVIVAKDGSGKYKTINEALKDIPTPKKGKGKGTTQNSNETFVIYVKAGVYPEYVTFTKTMNNVMLIGDGPDKTRITGSRSYKGGYQTYKSATVSKNLAYLGRPWKAYSRTLYTNCQIDGFIDPAGWLEWPGTTYHETCWYSEVGNRGAGANVAKRVNWPGVKKVTTQETVEFTVSNFLEGNGRDPWTRAAGVPVDA